MEEVLKGDEMEFGNLTPRAENLCHHSVLNRVHPAVVKIPSGFRF